MKNTRIIHGKTVKEALLKARSLYGDQIEVQTVTRGPNEFEVVVSFEDVGGLKDDAKLNFIKGFTSASVPIPTSINQAAGLEKLFSKKKLIEDLELFKASFWEESKSAIDWLKKTIKLNEYSAIIKFMEQKIKKKIKFFNATERGVYALVGANGVGKTTTLAKLAGTLRLQNEKVKILLLTIDDYKIGGFEQLKLYADMLNCDVKLLNEKTVDSIISIRGKYDFILVDTIGLSLKDERNEYQNKLLETIEAKKIVCIQSNLAQKAQWKQLLAYQSEEIYGLILTKIDEVESIDGTILGALYLNWSFLFIANGQRVPEDLHIPSSIYLASKAQEKLKNK